MKRTLLVTNDFPPRIGGIESYLRDFVSLLPAADVVVLASAPEGMQACRDYDRSLDFCIERLPGYPMLPTPKTAQAMQELIRREHIQTVWFGAAAPLGLLGKAARKAGATRVVASTHGHETGWAKFAAGRRMLRAIGNQASVVTYISEYTKNLLTGPFGPAPEFVHLPSGVDIERFRPVDSPQQRTAIRASLGFGTEPLAVCVSRLVPRKGQDELIRAWPSIVRRHPTARLVIAGTGPYYQRLFKLACQRFGRDGVVDAESFQQRCGSERLPQPARVVFTGRLSGEQMPLLLRCATVAAMPCRTRYFGIDVEGLGIVYLEGSASGIPCIAGDSGGAPETVTTDTGFVVPGLDTDALVDALLAVFDNPQRASRMGVQARSFVQEHFTWDVMGRRLYQILDG